MRGLTVRQKKALKKAVRSYFDTHRKYPRDASYLEEYDEIMEMNDSEIFYSCANSFLQDLKWDSDFDYMWRSY